MNLQAPNPSIERQTEMLELSHASKKRIAALFKKNDVREAKRLLEQARTIHASLPT